MHSILYTHRTHAPIHPHHFSPSLSITSLVISQSPPPAAATTIPINPCIFHAIVIPPCNGHAHQRLRGLQVEADRVSGSATAAYAGSPTLHRWESHCPPPCLPRPSSGTSCMHRQPVVGTEA